MAHASKHYAKSARTGAHLVPATGERRSTALTNLILSRLQLPHHNPDLELLETHDPQPRRIPMAAVVGDLITTYYYIKDGAMASEAVDLDELRAATRGCGDLGYFRQLCGVVVLKFREVSND